MGANLRIGLDFGSFNYRAAYLLGEEIVSVPIPPTDIAWRGMIVIEPDSKALPLGLVFNSLKYCLGDSRPVALGGARQAAEDVVSDILLAIRQTVITYAGEDIDRVVLTVPARYAAYRRAVLRQVAQTAGFRQVDLVNDCTAAALGHTFGRQEPGTFLVYSMGFQGFECGLVRFARQQFRELAHDGAAEPAGRDVDQRLMVAVITELKKAGIIVPVRVWTGQHWFELRALVSNLKERLSSEAQAYLEIPSFLTNADPVHFGCTRQILEEAIAPDVDGTLKIVERTLEEAGLSTRDVDEVLLVGGSTRLSIVQKRLEAMFGSRLVQAREDLLARGAAIQASRLGEQVTATESLPRPETATTVEPARPDVEAAFAYAQQLVDQGRIEAARTFLEEIRARTSELLSHLPAN